MSRDPDGRIRYRMKRALPDGRTDLVLYPVDFLRRIASLVAPPRKHLTRYGGLFAPAARDRNSLCPPPSRRPRVRRRACRPAQSPAERTQSPPPSPSASSSAPSIDTAHLEARLSNPARPSHSARPTRTSWCDLLQRVYAFDVSQCPDCGGRRRIVVAISDPDTARRILSHLGIDSSAPSTRPARSPPEAQLAFAAVDPPPTYDEGPPPLLE